MNIQEKIDYLKKARKALKEHNERVGKTGWDAFLSYTDFIWAYGAYGCLINQYVNGNFWRYKRFERKKILTQRGLEEFISKCNDRAHWYKLCNKVEFNRFFSKFIRRKWLASESMDFSEFQDLLNTCSEIIIKPLEGMEGQGIRAVKTGTLIEGNSAKELFITLKKGKFIVEERIYNHPNMNFNNKSINTLRINTMMDKDGNVHIFKPVLRVGVGESVVDNYSAGGCEYSIDADTGIIQSLRFGNYKLEGLTHPGCEKIMIGYQIPMWTEVVGLIKEACSMIPECRFLGWDVAITDKGPQLIEANHRPGMVGIEYFGETGWYEKLKKYI